MAGAGLAGSAATFAQAAPVGLRGNPNDVYVMNVMVSAHPYWVPVYQGFKQGFQQVPRSLAQLFRAAGGEIRLGQRLGGKLRGQARPAGGDRPAEPASTGSR